MADYRIVSLSEVPHHLETVARWSNAEWGASLGYSLRETTGWFRGMLENPDEDCVVAVSGDDVLGMTCLVDHDLESRPDLRHWIASVFVVPERRGKGIASAMIRAAERHAAGRGFPLLYLYTRGVEELYEKLGWKITEHFTLDGDRFALMIKQPAR
ncbi:GNAT family N-acetyltransferase [Nisaea sediminum]|uniref:GNAT family N-acetyltransferase n=1 Tax=Nisaea sediminum TaxID=2775867 RepID=UPI0018690278|nr:GNAT family N-acetyltransferase [Nisaea sediminum]